MQTYRLIAAVTFVIASAAGGGNATAQQRDPRVLIANINAKQASYKRCLVEQTVELGADNSEPAETILRAVSATCHPVEDELRALYAEAPFPQSDIERQMTEDRKAGEDAGIAALLQKRREMRSLR